MRGKEESITISRTLILAGCEQDQDSSTTDADSAASDQTSMVATTKLTATLIPLHAAIPDPFEPTNPAA